MTQRFKHMNFTVSREANLDKEPPPLCPEVKSAAAGGFLGVPFDLGGRNVCYITRRSRNTRCCHFFEFFHMYCLLQLSLPFLAFNDPITCVLGFPADIENVEAERGENDRASVAGHSSLAVAGRGLVISSWVHIGHDKHSSRAAWVKFQKGNIEG